MGADLQNQLIDELKSMELGIEKRLPQNQESIFHYTTADGLLGILKHNQLWVSHIDFLNDPLEMQHTYNITLELMQRDLHVNDEFEHLVYSTLQDKQLLRVQYEKPYVFSASLDSDSLIMWQQYAKGEGYNIAVNWSHFKFWVEHPNRSFYFDYGLVEYKRDRQEYLIEGHLLKIYELWDRYRKLGLGTDLVNEHVSHYVAWSIPYFSMFMKRQGFEHEKEFRCVFAPIKDWDYETRERSMKLIHHRPRNGIILPYMTILNNSESPAVRDIPVHTVRLGPSLPYDWAELGVQQLLESTNRTTCSIVPSSFPSLR